MRHLAVATLGAGALLAAPAAQAQTYAGGPVCLHGSGPVSYYECRYTSLAECNATASGRGAQCVLNPYAANAGSDRMPPRHRSYRTY